MKMASKSRNSYGIIIICSISGREIYSKLVYRAPVEMIAHNLFIKFALTLASDIERRYTGSSGFYICATSPGNIWRPNISWYPLALAADKSCEMIDSSPGEVWENVRSIHRVYFYPSFVLAISGTQILLYLSCWILIVTTVYPSSILPVIVRTFSLSIKHNLLLGLYIYEIEIARSAWYIDYPANRLLHLSPRHSTSIFEFITMYNPDRSEIR